MGSIPASFDKIVEPEGVAHEAVLNTKHKGIVK
jgi:hypothetical protein